MDTNAKNAQLERELDELTTIPELHGKDCSCDCCGNDMGSSEDRWCMSCRSCSNCGGHNSANYCEDCWDSRWESGYEDGKSEGYDEGRAEARREAEELVMYGKSEIVEVLDDSDAPDGAREEILGILDRVYEAI